MSKQRLPESGKIVILSGPSGSGKTTLYKRLLASKSFHNDLVKSLSLTTRPRRHGEKDGQDYWFVSKKFFQYKIRAKHFLEWQKVFDHYYGTPHRLVLELLKQGKNVLLCIDVQGAKEVCQKYPPAVKIFITVPSLAVLKSRLKKRGSEGEKSLKIRLATARKELQDAPKYDHIIVNDNLSKALIELKTILSQRL